MKEKFPANLKAKFQGKEGISQDNSPSWVLDNLPGKTGHCYGIERGNKFVKRLKLMFRTGRTVSIPYAYLPVIVHTPGRDLKLKTGEIEVTLTGRGLDKLEGWLNEEKVIWIRESNTGIDDSKDDVFVSGITVEGELFD